jgi:O-antigen/teichoic acid export membrane protein
VANPYGQSAVRASLLHFLLGKGFNAIVSLLILIALARWMAPEHYGAYIALLALQATLLALSGLGIDTTAERFLPELRTRHTDDQLLGFVVAALAARLLSLALLGFLALLFAQQITSLVGLAQHVEVFKIWIGTILLTGVFVFAVIMLEAMLHQRKAQVCMGIYVLVKLTLLVVAHQRLGVDLKAVVQIEFIATGLSAFLAVWVLVRGYSFSGLRSGWKLAGTQRQRMQRFALFNYSAQVIFQFFNADSMKLLITRLTGVTESARYGFAYSLSDTVQRYLPAVLLSRLIKPIFISRYSKSGDFTELNSMASLTLKLNLLVLIPAIVLAVTYGAEALDLLSKGKYGDAQWILVGALSLLVPGSHQLVLSLLASTLEKNSMQLYAGLVSAIAFPIALFLIPSMGALGAISASICSALLYNVFATLYLRRAGYPYRPDLRGFLAFLSAGVLTFLICQLAKVSFPGVSGVFIAVTAGSLTYLGIVKIMNIFSDKERNLLNSILPKPVFFL